MPLFQSRTGLSLQDLLTMRLFYMAKLIGHKASCHKVGWKSQETQEARFAALLAAGDIQGKSILDFGCGLGCLYGYLRELGWKGE